MKIDKTSKPAQINPSNRLQPLRTDDLARVIGGVGEMTNDEQQRGNMIRQNGI